jgi:hypothetical protein
MVRLLIRSSGVAEYALAGSHLLAHPIIVVIAFLKLEPKPAVPICFRGNFPKPEYSEFLTPELLPPNVSNLRLRNLGL